MKKILIVNKVRESRESHESKDAMTQSELGAMVFVTRQTIAAIEQGRYSPSLETAFRIARVFDLGFEDIFSWHE
jgi:putative transcriptional regulator